MVKKLDDLFRLCDVSREEWMTAISLNPGPEDRFAKTFAAKATAYDLWPALGLLLGTDLVAAVAWSISTRVPRTANLQLLHTFHRFRRMGAGRQLCKEMLSRSREAGSVYVRVSSEPEAVEFYRSLGVVFQGEQRSGCLLAVGRLAEAGGWENCNWDPVQPAIAAALRRKGRGGCVRLFQ